MQIPSYDPRLHFKVHIDSDENPSYKVSEILKRAERIFLGTNYGSYSYKFIPVVIEIERLNFKSFPIPDLHKESKEQSKLTIKQKLLLK